MSTPYLSEIRVVSFNFPPRGWALCNGQILPINQNQALFSLLGTTYGGEGRVNFALPNLQGSVPLHVGSGGGSSYVLGQTGGEALHTLTIAEMVSHTHLVTATSDAATTASPAGATLAAAGNTVGSVYAPGPANTPLAPASLVNAGGSQPHENRQPYLTLNFIIALQGIFPSRS